MRKIILFIGMIVLLSSFVHAEGLVTFNDTADSGDLPSVRWASADPVYSSTRAYEGTYSIYATVGNHSYTEVNNSLGGDNLTVMSYFYDSGTTTTNRLFGYGVYGGGSNQALGIWEGNDANFVYKLTFDSGIGRSTGWHGMGVYCNTTLTKFYYINSTTGVINNFINTTDGCYTGGTNINGAFLQIKSGGDGYWDNLVIRNGDFLGEPPVIIPIPPPLQVENLTIEDITTTQINVSWDYNAQITGGVNITVGGTNNGYTAYPEVSYLITGLTKGTAYNITVLATNLSGTNYTNSTENNILTTTPDNYIGLDFDGEIDTFTIFDHALNLDEIIELYSGGFTTPSINTNMTTSTLSYPTLSFDVNVSLFGLWNEGATCTLIDNVTWVSCSPASYSINTTNSSIFTCTSDISSTGDVSVYAQCDGTVYELVNSTSVVYTFKDYYSIIAGSTLNLPFNNTIQDFSVNLVATWMETSGIVTTPSYGISFQGINNDALSTSVDDYLRFNNSDISYAATSTMTFWANAYTNYTSAGELVHSKFGKVSYNSSNALLSYSVNDTTTLKTIVYPINLTGSYNFISVVCDSGTSTMYLYINATLVNSSGSTTCTELE